LEILCAHLGILELWLQKRFLQCKGFIYYRLGKQTGIVEYTTYAAKFGIRGMELQSVQNLLFYKKPVSASFCLSRAEIL